MHRDRGVHEKALDALKTTRGKIKHRRWRGFPIQSCATPKSGQHSLRHLTACSHTLSPAFHSHTKTIPLECTPPREHATPTRPASTTRNGCMSVTIPCRGCKKDTQYTHLRQQSRKHTHTQARHGHHLPSPVAAIINDGDVRVCGSPEVTR